MNIQEAMEVSLTVSMYKKKDLQKLNTRAHPAVKRYVNNNYSNHTLVELPDTLIKARKVYRPQKNSVWVVEVVITPPPILSDKLAPQEIDELYKATIKWLKTSFGLQLFEVHIHQQSALKSASINCFIVPIKKKLVQPRRKNQEVNQKVDSRVEANCLCAHELFSSKKVNQFRAEFNDKIHKFGLFCKVLKPKSKSTNADKLEQLQQRLEASVKLVEQVLDHFDYKSTLVKEAMHSLRNRSENREILPHSSSSINTDALAALSYLPDELEYELQKVTTLIGDIKANIRPDLMESENMTAPNPQF